MGFVSRGADSRKDSDHSEGVFYIVFGHVFGISCTLCM